MRILAVGNMYPPHRLGGYELVWQSAMRSLVAAGDEVRVLTTDFELDPRPEEDPFVARLLRWYWRDHEFPRLSLAERLRLERHNKKTLAAQIEAFSPEVVAWWALGGMSMALIEQVRAAGIPAVGFVLDDWHVYGPLVDGWERAVRRLGGLGRAASRSVGVAPLSDLGNAARWVFISDTTRRAADAVLASLPPSELAHPGIDLTRFELRPEKPWEWRLLYSGRIDPRKGVDVALRALAGLPDARLSIAGSGPEPAQESRLRELAAQLGVAKRVDFPRLDRDEIARAYGEADAVLFPVQWEEPWGLVPLEAMAVGTPVVASGAGGSSEYLRDEENCLLFRPRDDASALARCVERLATEPGLRRHLREEGRATAETFTEEKFNEAVRSHLVQAARQRKLSSLP